ncbi:MAG: peptidoglycan editing factor PgeF [Clostridia bacterium]|nr:peptidoglycan editing factor PgeF [Clostridia bacterium]
MMKSNNLTIVKKGDLQYIQFPKLARLDCVRHIFSTRHGGVSKGEFASMNLSFSRDDRETVLKNYEILCGAVGIDTANLVLSHQTHTNNVLCVDKSHCGTGVALEPFSDIDGLITNVPGVALVTQYADCTPLLFCDPVKRVIATSHSGWRGTVKQIGKVTVEKMVSCYGCDTKDIIAAIGPCIGKCCYEVDDPVYELFLVIPDFDTEGVITVKGGGKYMLDLAEANRRILIGAGIKPTNIDVSDICTCCNSEHLHSHRATGGKRGNLAAIIELA